MPWRPMVIYRDDEPIEIDVTFEREDYYPQTGPSWDSPGEPASGGQAFITDAHIGGKPFALTPEEIEKLEVELNQDPTGSEDF